MSSAWDLSYGRVGRKFDEPPTAWAYKPGQPATIEIDVEDTGVVVLKGSVSTTAAKDKARQLAQDTVGVTEVIDHLAVAREAAKE